MSSPTFASRLRSVSAARGSLVAAALVPALLFLYAGYERRWAGDDGFINTRVVEQLMDGNGFVFNAGERSEAVTSAGWVLLLWLCGELGLNVDSAGWVLGLALSFIGLLAAALAAARITRPESVPDTLEPSTLVLPLGVLAYAAIPVAWDYQTSLLENGLGLGFLGTAYLLLARALTSPLSHRHAAIGAFVGLAPIMRPDYALYAAPMILILVAATPRWKPRLVVAACSALPGALFELFRMGYFAGLVPNTAVAKEAFDARWDQGLHYFDNTIGTYQLWLPLALGFFCLIATVVGLLRQKLLLRALLPSALAASAALHMLYVVRLGGDFMHGRMLLPALFMFFAAVGTVRVPLRPRWQAGAGVAAFVAMAAFGVYCAHSLRPEMYVNQILDERRWWSETAGEPHPTHLEHYTKHNFYNGPLWVKNRIAEGCPAGLASLGNDIGDVCKRVAWPDALDGQLSDHKEGELLGLDTRNVAPQVVAVYAFRPLGISGRVMGLRINLTDSFGLADPLAAHMELTERGRPGHEKIFSTVWWAAKYTATGVTQDPRVLLAKRALACGPLHELQRAIHEPLTFGRFFKNVGLALQFHRLRVPADPQAAVDRFCKS
jgi:arabinofuranosyltransferase